MPVYSLPDLPYDYSALEDRHHLRQNHGSYIMGNTMLHT